jgi:hypothetical protein
LKVKSLIYFVIVAILGGTLGLVIDNSKVDGLSGMGVDPYYGFGYGMGTILPVYGIILFLQYIVTFFFNSFKAKNVILK